MIDKYRLIAVVDSARSISQSEVSPANLFWSISCLTQCKLLVCIRQSLKANDMPPECKFKNRSSIWWTHFVIRLSKASKYLSIKQVKKVGEALSTSFVNNQQSNKVVVNLTDQYSVNNNCGFNLANFKPRFIREFFSDVVSDYNRSFIGAFCTALFEHELA